jgi:cephalosporin hydroxylase
MIESQQQLSLEWKHTFVLDLWRSQVGIHHGETCKGISLAKFPQDFWSYEKIIHQSIPPVIFEICINMHGFALWLYDQFPAATLENINTKRMIIDVDLNIAAAEANLSPLQSIENNRATINLVKCDLVDKNLVESSVNQDSLIIGDRSDLII